MSNDKKQHTAEIIDPGLGELDKVRNILFGRQVKAYEDRFQELEQSLQKMVDDLQQHVEERFTQVEQQLLDAETSNTQSFSDVRADLDNLAAALGTDLAQGKAELRSAIDKVGRELSDSKTDRRALAKMFDEMSIRLRGEDA